MTKHLRSAERSSVLSRLGILCCVWGLGLIVQACGIEESSPPANPNAKKPANSSTASTTTSDATIDTTLDTATPVDSSTATTTTNGGTGTGGVDPIPATCAEKTALAFAQYIEPGIDSSCAGCHNNSGNPVPLYKAKPIDNRIKLLAWTKYNAQYFFDFISKSPNALKEHSGGNKSAAMPKTNIDAWIQVEVSCKGQI